MRSSADNPWRRRLDTAALAVANARNKRTPLDEGISKRHRSRITMAYVSGPAESPPDGLIAIESCHSTWLFDELRRRFRRIVRTSFGAEQVTTEWRPYERLVIDERADGFLVFLDKAGTRLLRSRRHLEPCSYCEESPTEELASLDTSEAAGV